MFLLMTAVGGVASVLTAQGLRFDWHQTVFIIGVVMMSVGATNIGRILQDGGEDEWEDGYIELED